MGKVAQLKAALAAGELSSDSATLAGPEWLRPAIRIASNAATASG